MICADWAAEPTPAQLMDWGVEKRYSPDQPRDDHGRFGAGGDPARVSLVDKLTQYHAEAVPSAVPLKDAVMSEHLRSIALDAIAKETQLHPTAAGHIKVVVGPLQSSLLASTHRDGPKGDSHGESTITLAEKYWGPGKESLLNTVLRESSNQDWHVPGTEDPRYTVIHEYAHAYGNYIGIGGFEPAAEEWLRGLGVTVDDALLISNYADTSAKEFVAEAYEAHRAGAFEPGGRAWVIANTIGTALDKAVSEKESGTWPRQR